MAQPLSRPIFDLDESSRFLTLLDESASFFTFQVFDDRKPQRRELSRILHGPLEQHSAELKRLNDLGAGIYITVNETDGKGRKLDNILRVRALWLEDDGNGKRLPLEPHISVQSSPGRYHHYLLCEGVSLIQFRGLQEALVKHYGSDPGAKDLARVLRLPGFFHNKTKVPHAVRIIHESGGQPYSADALMSAFGLQESAEVLHISSRRDDIKPGEPIADDRLRDIKEALAKISAEDYHQWVTVGMALKSTGAGEDAFKLWDAWSQSAEGKYSERVMASKWVSFNGVGITLSTLFWMAKPDETVRMSTGRTAAEGWMAAVGASGDRKPIHARFDLLCEELESLNKYKFNQLTHSYEVNGEKMTDVHISEERNRLLKEKNISANKSDTTDAMHYAASRAAYDPLADYLNGLIWDGKERLHLWLATIYGADLNNYTKRIGKSWLVGAVNRALKPSDHHRMMVIICGNENIGKSKSLRDLAVQDEWFSDCLPSDLKNTKAAVEAMMGKWIIESAEVLSLRKSEQEAVKAFISRPMDQVRLAYKRMPEVYMRRCVIVGTSNEDHPLAALEQNTRFFPFTARKYDRDILLGMRDQLWAEATAIYRDGWQWWDMQDIVEDLKNQRDKFKQTDSWEEALSELDPALRYQMKDLLWQVKVDLGKTNRGIEIKIGHIMKELGWDKERKRVRNQLFYEYYKSRRNF